MYQLKHVKCLEDNKRPQIVTGIEVVCSHYSQGLKTVSEFIPPRVGKSTVMRGAAIELPELGAPTTIILEPWVGLADQMKDEEKVNEMCSRLGILKKVTGHRVESFRTQGWYKTRRGIPNFSTVTLALAQKNEMAFLDGIQELREITGVPVPVFFDECQLLKRGKPWGDLAEKAQEAGAFIGVFTGTPVSGMPGFDEIIVGGKEPYEKGFIKRITKGGNIEWVKQTYAINKAYTNVVADYTITYDDAWGMGALAQTSAAYIDAVVVDKGTGEALGKLSELSKDQLSGRLRHCLESPEMVGDMAAKSLSRLLDKRKSFAGAQWLIVTGFDFAEDHREKKNHHAGMFKSAISQLLASIGHPGLQIGIATQTDSDGNPNDKSADLIKAFTRGNLDVLIVKMMGVVGTDAPACKLLTFASTMREGPLVAQTLLRASTVWAGNENCGAELILPADVAMREAWDQIKDHGTGVKIDSMLLEEEIIPPPELKSELEAQTPSMFGYADHNLNEAVGDRESLLALIKRKYITGNLTDVDLLKNYERGGYEFSEEEMDASKKESSEQDGGVYEDLDARLAERRGKFGPKALSMVARWGQRQTPQIIVNTPIYMEYVKRLQASAKEACGFAGKVSQVDDVGLLDQLIDALDLVSPRVLPGYTA